VTRYLLDTDTCIHALKTYDKVLIAKLTSHEGEIATSAVVLHELYYGAQGYSDPQKRLFLIDELMKRLKVLPFDRSVAELAGPLRHKLRKKGQSIGPYDLQIGATALAHGLTLVTGNKREFSRLSGLKLENWISG
jgi:tRNA(fMet)-specific endonuclease VapC